MNSEIEVMGMLLPPPPSSPPPTHTHARISIFIVIWSRISIHLVCNHKVFIIDIKYLRYMYVFFSPTFLHFNNIS